MARHQLHRLLHNFPCVNKHSVHGHAAPICCQVELCLFLFPAPSRCLVECSASIDHQCLVEQQIQLHLMRKHTTSQIHVLVHGRVFRLPAMCCWWQISGACFHSQACPSVWHLHEATCVPCSTKNMLPLSCLLMLFVTTTSVLTSVTLSSLEMRWNPSSFFDSSKQTCKRVLVLHSNLFVDQRPKNHKPHHTAVATASMPLLGNAVGTNLFVTLLTVANMFGLHKKVCSACCCCC